MPNSLPSLLGGGDLAHSIVIRVRYSETDQMGTFYNSRPLDWFECGRTEILRSLGLPYSLLESRGVFLPLVTAHLDYEGRARYDDALRVTTAVRLEGRARLRCDVTIVHVEDAKPVVTGYTIHAFTNTQGKAMRPPPWVLAALNRSGPAKV